MNKYLVVFHDLNILQFNAEDELDAWFYALNVWGINVQDVFPRGEE